MHAPLLFYKRGPNTEWWAWYWLKLSVRQWWRHCQVRPPFGYCDVCVWTAIHSGALKWQFFFATAPLLHALMPAICIRSLIRPLIRNNQMYFYLFLFISNLWLDYPRSSIATTCWRHCFAVTMGTMGVAPLINLRSIIKFFIMTSHKPVNVHCYVT